jgi:pilus assembly protein CpaE
VDLGRPFPDVGHFLDVEPNYTIFDLTQNLADLDQSFIQRIMQSYGDKLAILHGCADFKEQDCLEQESLEKIFNILRSAYKWVVVDLSHWLDSLFFHVVKEADTVLLLTELTIPDLRNLKRLFPILQEWSVKGKVKLVVNRYQKANGLQLRDLEQAAQQPVFHSLASDYPALIKSVNQGTPLKEAAPRSKIYQGLQQLARMLAEEAPETGVEVERAPRKFWIFSRR